MKFLLNVLDFLRLFKIRSIGNINYQNIVIIGLIIGWLSYKNLERNWIPIELLIGISIFSGLIITIIFRKFYRQKLGFRWSLWHNMGIGLIISYIFMLSNDLLSPSPIVEKEYYISDLTLVQKRKRSGRLFLSKELQPKIGVQIDGIEHYFTLHSSRSKSALHTRKAIIGIKEGFWNYGIVKTIKLLNEK